MIILAVDYGDARTGLAVCDKHEMLASPVEVVHQYNKDKVIARIAEVAAEYRAERIVVGNPINMNGTQGPRSELCTEFAKNLEQTVGIPVVLWDERSTTVSAHNYLNVTDTRGKKRKNVVDAVAATIILENYLQYRKNNKEE
ncbi:MAG: Holliday junction resolvase RuvX [Oscillospiraceae bacterium]|nr:Holliday junction resolvase RuvX [Oscillospiraceae bacterium]